MEITKKIESLRKKIADLDKKIKSLSDEKETAEENLVKLEDTEILNIVRKQGVNVVTLSSYLDLMQFLRDNGISTDDIRQLVSPYGSKTPQQNERREKNEN